MVCGVDGVEVVGVWFGEGVVWGVLFFVCGGLFEFGEGEDVGEEVGGGEEDGGGEFVEGEEVDREVCCWGGGGE